RSIKGYNNMDYIACWFFKARECIAGYNASFAFVTTNSICQGEQVALLWPNILSEKIEIGFAYQSFKWTNNAKGNAGVTVIIVSIRNVSNKEKYLFDSNMRKLAKNINPYLLDASNVIVIGRNKPISKIPEMNFGSMPNDEGNLLLDKSERQKLLSDYPESKSIIKKFSGSREFIRGEDRYCLWITEENKQFAFSIPEIKRRIDSCEKYRNNSKREATNKLSKFPHRFGEVRYIDSESIIVPSVSSERREYIPMGFLNGDTIISNLAFGIYNAYPWLFAMLTSKMHVLWVKSVGGYLGTSIRYSAKVCYNTFPFPNITIKDKENLNQYVFDILDERSKYPEKTMAQLYDPDIMPSELKKAHRELDAAIERCYRLQPFTSDTERLEYLFKMYEEMLQKDTLFTKQKKSRTKKNKE
ncbi:MAG: type IIL restriction-modification enzyme MmeI, partial [Suipraeoptans sp.]